LVSSAYPFKKKRKFKKANSDVKTRAEIYKLDRKDGDIENFR